ncbi:RecX family transcriptional regulator [Candidatus Gottesmanbacteria bacterium]|nr:RecX family transcriptional regulator [Candidatus Gottesmanbacteria bacterium]
MADYDPYPKLLNAAFRFVSYRPRSQKEIRDFLEKKLKKYKLYAPTVIGKIMDRLKELGYVDDTKFAAWWVEQRSLHRPKGKRLLVEELRRKGIFTQTIILDERLLAAAAAKKKLPRWKLLSPLEKKKKMYDFLGRRGFSFEVIRTVVDEVLGKIYTGEEVE